MAGLNDKEFADRVMCVVTEPGASLLLQCNAFRGAVYSRRPESEWRFEAEGEIAEATVAALKRAASKKRLYWDEYRGEPSPLPADHALATAATIAGWFKRQIEATGVGGRQGEVTTDVRTKVAAWAAWRCQYDGCGEDLKVHLTGQRGNFGYFAHIIASSVDGPRGDLALSRQLANNPDNILLLCDKCHRLIDRIDPIAHDVDRLRAMRERSHREVNRILDSLRYPRTKAIVVGGHIEGQSAAFHQQAAESALWQRGLRLDGEPHWFLNNGHLGRDTTTDDYWALALENAEYQVQQLAGFLSGETSGTGAPEQVAVFPTHVTSILVLAGRLIGNARTVHLFQPDRNAPSDNPAGRWAWQKGAKPQGFFSVRELRPHDGREEAALLVDLTAPIPDSDWPWRNQSSDLPAIAVSAAQPHHSVIGTPSDLEEVGRLFDRALATLQDQWRVKRIHTVVVAPASSCVLLGQKLQARHHAEMLLYERRRARDPASTSPFVPSLAIQRKKVVHPNRKTSIAIP